MVYIYLNNVGNIALFIFTFQLYEQFCFSLYIHTCILNVIHTLHVSHLMYDVFIKILLRRLVKIVLTYLIVLYKIVHTMISINHS